jgi:Glu-tRNA(Gln) amidotransferase subunit E-like FAD-binding protein
MKKTLLALLLAAGGCASPNWKEPEMDQAPIVIEEAPREKPKTMKEATTPEKELKDYIQIEMPISYQFGSGTAARTFYGLVKLIEKDQGDKPLSDYEHMIIAFKANKDGNISSSDISNLVASYAKEKGMKEIKIPVVQANEDNLKRVYTANISVATEEVGTELRNMILDKSNAEKARIAEAVRSVYGGQNPLPIGPKQLQHIKEYLKN